ncbi:MAG: DUF2905 domain-containing protein [Spirochaetes bacterium]|jgi:hypothetical protein|nr:DUF2905 domain-containing protein [Spirochaetota bacterium]
MESSPGKTLIIAGLLIAALGAAIYFRDEIPFLRNFGRLPGDISIEKERFSFYFPVTTGIIISIILSLALYFFNRFR